MWDKNKILEMLPHRSPFLFIDRIIDIEKGKKGIGIKDVNINEPYFQGHFPSNPIMPGVLIIECMIQLAGIVFMSEQNGSDSDIKKSRIGYLVEVKNMKLKKKVVPGDQLVIYVEVTHKLGNLCRVNAEAKVKDEIVAEGELTFAKGDR